MSSKIKPQSTPNEILDIVQILSVMVAALYHMVVYLCNQADGVQLHFLFGILLWQ